jgi:hypothetical protein
VYLSFQLVAALEGDLHHLISGQRLEKERNEGEARRVPPLMKDLLDRIFSGFSSHKTGDELETDDEDCTDVETDDEDGTEDEDNQSGDWVTESTKVEFQ